MNKKVYFRKGDWEDFLFDAYSMRFKARPRVIQSGDYIANGESSLSADGFDYTTILCKESLGVGTKVSSTCTYSDSAAPLLVFTKEIFEDEEGFLRYGDHIEVVLFKNGINVWNLFSDGDTVKPLKLLHVAFDVAEDERHSLNVEVLENYLTIEVDGRSMLLRIEGFYERFYVGLSLCEGPTKFYDFSVQGSI